APLRRSRPLRRDAQARHDLHVRVRRALLPRSGARAPPRTDRLGGSARALPRVGHRLGQREVRLRRRPARLGLVARVHELTARTDTVGRSVMDEMIIVSSDSHAGVPKELWPEYLEPRFHELIPGLHADNEIYPTAIFLLGAKRRSTTMLPELQVA